MFDCVEVEEETAKRIKRLNLINNPVKTIKGVQKLVALEAVEIDNIDFVPRWIEELPAVKKVELRGLKISELPSWLFAIPTLNDINSWSMKNLRSLDFGSKPSTNLTKLLLTGCPHLKSLPNDFFAHALEEVDISQNQGGLISTAPKLLCGMKGGNRL